jgi:hypothetical protein
MALPPPFVASFPLYHFKTPFDYLIKEYVPAGKIVTKNAQRGVRVPMMIRHHGGRGSLRGNLFPN